MQQQDCWMSLIPKEEILYQMATSDKNYLIVLINIRYFPIVIWNSHTLVIYFQINQLPSNLPIIFRHFWIVRESIKFFRFHWEEEKKLTCQKRHMERSTPLPKGLFCISTLCKTPQYRCSLTGNKDQTNYSVKNSQETWKCFSIKATSPHSWPRLDNSYFTYASVSKITSLKFKFYHFILLLI